MSTSADMPSMVNTAIAPWYGGKRTMAPLIVEELGPHRAYWEPFCGSMAVLFQKPEAAHETVNDLHADLINLGRVLQDEASALALFARVSRTLCHETIYRDSEAIIRETEADQNPDQKSIERAYHFVVTSWLGRNGIAGTHRQTHQFAVRWTPGGGQGGTRWAGVIDSIPAWHRRLRRVVILQRNALELVEKIEDAPGIAIYCDPPYMLSTRSKSATRYVHDFQAADHAALAEGLRRFRRARVVVSYYDDPTGELDRLYEGWTKRDCARNKNLHTQHHRASEGETAPEILYLNGPSFAGKPDQQKPRPKTLFA